MGTGGEIFKGLIKGFPTKPPISSNISKIKTDIKGYESPKPLSFAGAWRQVIRGSKVPDAGIRADRSGWKKVQGKVKTTQQPVASSGAFGSKSSFEIRKAYLYLKQMMKTNPALAREIAKRYPRGNFISEDRRAQAIINEVLKYKKSPFKGVIGKNTDKWRIIEEEKKMKRAIASTPSMTKERMMKKLKLDVYEGLMGRDTGGQNRPANEISKTIPDRGVDGNTFPRN
jgi:hypothetical protein